MKTLDEIRRLTKHRLGEMEQDVLTADAKIQVIQSDATTEALINEALEVAQELRDATMLICSELENLKWELSKAMKAEAK